MTSQLRPQRQGHRTWKPGTVRENGRGRKALSRWQPSHGQEETAGRCQGRTRGWERGRAIGQGGGRLALRRAAALGSEGHRPIHSVKRRRGSSGNADRRELSAEKGARPVRGDTMMLASTNDRAHRHKWFPNVFWRRRLPTHSWSSTTHAPPPPTGPHRCSRPELPAPPAAAPAPSSFTPPGLCARGLLLPRPGLAVSLCAPMQCRHLTQSTSLPVQLLNADFWPNKTPTTNCLTLKSPTRLSNWTEGVADWALNFWI